MSKSQFFKSIFISMFLVFFISGTALYAQAPTVTTGTPATNIQTDQADVSGTVNANGVSTTAYFEYGLTVAYGGTMPVNEGTITGSSDTPVTATLYELSADTTYHYRLVATNANGTTEGADQTFTTLGLPPGALTNEATLVTPTTARLNSSISTRDLDTTVVFQYGTTVAYGTQVDAWLTPIPAAFSYLDDYVDISSLSNNTTYHFRVVATNANGTSYGDDMTFTTGTPPAPAATTAAATGVTNDGATLNGTVNANNFTTTVVFEYGETVAYGTTTNAAQSPVSGTTNTAVSRAISGLLPNTTYHYRVAGTNGGGTTNGSDMTFTTLPSPPTVAVDPASGIAATGATLNGTVNANGGSTAVTFQYGLDTGYGSTAAAAQNPVTGTTGTGVSATITGLSDGVTYHYRVMAVNAGGTTYSADMTFTAGASAPTATTNAAGGIGATSATFNGTVNANGAASTVTFELGEDTNYGRSFNADQSPVSGTTATAVSATLNDLTAATTYHYRVVAENGSGTAYGADMTFTTNGAPTVTTAAAASVTDTGATVNGTVNANNQSSTVTFDYGLTTGYGSSAAATPSPVTGAADTPVSAALSGLTPGNTYHYRVVATNGDGTSYGADMTFFTAAPAAPTVTTDAATLVVSDGATLNGTVNANNVSTTVTFEYGPTVAYGSSIAAVPGTVTGGVDTPVSVSLSGLAPGTYNYRVVGVNGSGTTNGANMTFTTGTDPAGATVAATNITGVSATLNGIANANGNTPVYIYFNYGLTAAYGTDDSGTPGNISGGTENTAGSLEITGLTPSTTYHFRIDVWLWPGTHFYGEDMTFTTAASGGVPPTAVTDAASGVGTAVATLNGTVNAMDDSTTVSFEYGPDTDYGQNVPAVPGTVTGGGDTAVSIGLSGLLSNATYHYRVAATNAYGTTYGADMTVTTDPSPPTAVTNAATALTSTTATLNGTVNPNNESTVINFEYGLTTGYGTTTAADQSPLTATGGTPVTLDLTGLTPDTTYHYRVTATNANGTSNGTDMTFYTGTTVPTVTTEAANEIGSTRATMHGRVIANNAAATVTFQYGETNAYGRIITATPSPVTGSSSTPVSATPTDLASNTTYHYRVVGENAAGITYGADMTFTTFLGGTPMVTTADVTRITSGGARSGGEVTDEGDAPVTARGVCWSTSTNPTTGNRLTSNGTGAGGFTSNITGLTGGVRYYVRAYAVNVYGTSYGDEFSFITGNYPMVTTSDVTAVTSSSAVCGGIVTSEGGSSVTARGVCWSTHYNPTINDNTTNDGTGTGEFVSTLIGLVEGNRYYVRAYATNSKGTAYGRRYQFIAEDSNVTVTITEPGDGEMVAGTVTIAADVEDTEGGTIAGVEFYAGDTLVGETSTAPYQVDWDTTAVEDGSYSVNVQAYNQDGGFGQDTITVNVSNDSAGLTVNRSSLTFGAVAGGTVPANQTMMISNLAVTDWDLSYTSSWLSCTPVTGTTPTTVSAGADPTGLAAGTYTDTITVVNSDDPGDTVSVPVTLNVYAPGTTSPPFGVFATPVDASTVMGGIPVTGWALDDIGVEKVSIYYSDNGGAMEFIGDAVFVEGARPDVEAAYPDYPNNYTAGWGYMLLTNLLPNQGNGSFLLYAVAQDVEGNQVTLGTKAIMCDNANAVKPFGAIDSPVQGGTANGSDFVNWGWVLTPQPNTVPTDGSTIMVWVDGVPLGHPVYNMYRSDIATLFPGYNNSDGAVGYFNLDTTAYENGVHTIAWSAADDAGNSDGIGSRYFTIQNTGGSDQAAAQGIRSPSPVDNPFGHLKEQELEQGNLGIKELEHVEFLVSGEFTNIRGYLSANGKARPLPIGSTLDKETGKFYWSPGLGFVGNYRLVFVIEKADGNVERKKVTISIQPK